MLKKIRKEKKKTESNKEKKGRKNMLVTQRNNNASCLLRDSSTVNLDGEKKLNISCTINKKKGGRGGGVGVGGSKKPNALRDPST